MRRLLLVSVVALGVWYGPRAAAEPPPLREAIYRATLTETALVVETTLRITRPERGTAAVRLMPASFPLVGALPRLEGARIEMRAGAYWLVVEPGGGAEAELKLSFRAPVMQGSGWTGRLRRLLPAQELRALPKDWIVGVARDPVRRACVLPVVPAVKVVAELPGACHELAAAPAAPIEKTQGGWRLYAPARRVVFLSWRTRPSTKAAVAFRVDADASVTVAERSLTADTSLTVDVLQGELRTLSVALPEGSQLREVSGKEVARWRLLGRLVRIELRTPATKQVAVTVRTEALAEQPGEFVWQPVAVGGAQHQGGRAYFRALPGLLLRAVDRKGFERLSDGYAPDAAAGRQTLVLAYPRLPASLGLAVERLQPRLTAAVSMLAHLERGIVTQRAVIDYTIHDVGVRRFRVRVGEGADVLEVACPGLLDHEVAKGILTVRLRDAVKDKGQLRLVVQRPVRRINGVVIPRLLALGVERQTGLVGVAAAADVELRHHRAVEAEQIDVRLLPAWVKKLGPKLAYRYYDRPNSLVAVETAARQAEFDVVATETCRLGDTGWHRDVAWECRIPKGEVFAWRLRVPEGVVPLEVACTVPAKVPARSQKGAPAVSVLKDWEFDEASRVVKVALARGVTGLATVTARLAQRDTEPETPAPLAAVVLEGVRRHTGTLRVATAVPVALRSTRAEGLEAKPGRTGELAFSQEAADWSLELAGTTIEPVIAVQAVTVLAMRPGQVAAEMALRYSIQKAPVNELTLRLPPGALNSSVRGRDIKSSQLDGDVWTLRLARKVQGAFELTLSYDYLTPAEGGTCACGTAETPDAARHEGFVVVARDSERIEVAVEQAQGLFEVDPADVPGRRPRAVLAAYRYAGRGSLTARIDVLGRADVLQAKALGAIVETMIKADGQTITQLTYDIRNVSRQFLRIELPTDADLLGAYVDGKPVPSAVEPDGATLVPLLAGARATRTAGTVEDVLEVSIFYVQQNAALARGRTVVLSSPPVDVRTEALSWAVYLPDGYRAQRTDGNMKLLFSPPSHRMAGLLRGMFRDESRLVDLIGSALSFLWRLFVALFVRYGVLSGFVLLVVCGIYLLARRGGKLAKRLREAAAAPVFGLRLRPVIGLAVVLLVLAVLAGMLLPSLARSREEARRIRARNNLNQIAKGFATYLNEHGDNRFYPGSGKTLYDSGVIPDPGVFVDPETGRPFVYLYEGRYLRDDYPPNKAMGYMEGDGVVHMLFFDSHVETFKHDDPKLAQLAPGHRFHPPMEGRKREDFLTHALRPSQPSAASPRGRLGGSEGGATFTIDGQLADSAGPKTRRSMGDLKKHGAEYFALRVPRERFDRLNEEAEEDLRVRGEIDKIVGKEAQGKLDYGQKKLLDRIQSRGRKYDYYKGERRAGTAMAPGTTTATYAGMRRHPPSAATATPPAKTPHRRTTPTPGPDEPERKPPARPDLDLARPVEGTEPAPPPGDPEDPGPGHGRGDKRGGARVQNGGAVAGGGDQWGETHFAETARWRYAQVRGGRQKGALPILFELPSEESLPYIFHRPVTGGALGEIELDCRPMGASRSAKGVLILGVVALLGLVGVGAKKRFAPKPRKKIEHEHE